MTIEPTAYIREDGVEMIRDSKTGRWLLRKIRGPAWFYNRKTERWVIVTTLTPDALEDLAYEHDTAMSLMESLPALTEKWWEPRD